MKILPFMQSPSNRPIRQGFFSQDNYFSLPVVAFLKFDALKIRHFDADHYWAMGKKHLNEAIGEEAYINTS